MFKKCPYLTLLIQNGDDSVTVKSGSHNVLVENSIFQDGHGCNIGSIQGRVSTTTATYSSIHSGGGRIKARHWVDEWVVVENVRAGPAPLATHGRVLKR